MLEIFRYLTSKSKILLIGFVLILAPIAIISYMSMQSVNQKAENLKLNYTGTIRLVRDKLENGILKLEENLYNQIAEYSSDQNTQEFQEWLGELEKKDSAFQYLFLVNNEMGLLSSMISSNWSNDNTRNNTEEKLLLHADFKKAEEAEFRQKNCVEAIRYYKRVLDTIKDNQGKAFVLARIGRCYYKSGNFEKGIVEYKKLLDIDNESNIGNVPTKVVALSQLSTGYSKINRNQQLMITNLQLYRYLIENSWDIFGGDYPFYLNSVTSEIQGQRKLYATNDSILEELDTLNNKKNKINNQIEFIKLLEQNLIPEIEAELNRKNLSETQKHKILKNDSESEIQIGYFWLPASFLSNDLIIMGYQFNENYLLSKQIPEMLSTVELGKDVLLGIIDKKDSLLFIQNGESITDYLVTENFKLLFESWKVAFFNKDGQTIEELVGKEKNLYRILIGGIILLMLIGLVVIIRAVIHESEMARIKSEFVSNVSHELKTPLALIRMFGETLDSGIVSDEKKRKEFYGIIRTESERLTHLINNVLDFSKMDTGRKKYNFVKADLVQVVRNSVEAYKFHIRENGFEITGEFPDESIMLNIDKDSISQSVLNLLSNAVKYSDKTKYIKIKVSKDETSAIISVSDKGIGIPKIEMKKIFEKFYRVSNEQVQESKGTGLGLTLTKQIVEAHDGEINVESEPGKGSRFTIKIPLLN